LSKKATGQMKKLLTATLLLIAIHMSTVPAIADMFKWVDKNGVMHFSDTPPPKSEQNVETLETSNYKEPPPKPALSEAESVPTPTPKEKVKKESVNSGKVEIFTTSWCRYCKDAVAFLRSNRIEFQQYDIEKDRQAAERMRSLGGRGGVPFAVINGNMMYGFSAESYKKALGLR
jgi:glutaredoxin